MEVHKIIYFLQDREISISTLLLYAEENQFHPAIACAI
jgi:hypothetical protein